MKEKAPCLKCPHRSVSCHGSCADYLAWKVYQAKQKAIAPPPFESAGDSAWKRESVIEKAHRTGRTGRKGL